MLVRLCNIMGSREQAATWAETTLRLSITRSMHQESRTDTLLECGKAFYQNEAYAKAFIIAMGKFKAPSSQRRLLLSFEILAPSFAFLRFR
jgi:hypothetical protein